MEPVELPQDPLHPVADHRGPDPPADGDPDLPGDGPDFRRRTNTAVPVDGKMRRGRAHPQANHVPVFAVGTKDIRLGKPKIPHRPLPFPIRMDYFLPLTETASRFRPFARRRERTSLPAGVDMRRRNPWVRSRRLLCGW
jgi:hypothetical protein